MSKSEFDESKRERFLDESKYTEFIKNFSAMIDECRGLLGSQGTTLERDDGRHIDWRWGIASSSLQLLIGGYSVGTPIAAMPSDFVPVLSAIEATALPHDYRTEPFYLDELDTYAYAMWLLSLCKLLRLDPLLPRVVRLFDVARDDNRGKDALFEALLDKLGQKSVRTKGMLKNLKSHPLLLQAIEAEPKKRSLYVAEFLKKWYPSMKATYWYGRHERVPQNFFGYWAFEAGLVSYLWDIDDSGYRDLPFYPKDLVDYARAHPQIDAAALGGSNVEGAQPGIGRTVRAGEPCPREGYWFTPAKVGSRRHFEAGDVMPSVGGDYGVTIWQRDEKQD
jgi:Domain of unknown function (DUF1911)/Domain of unknown function (DUF1910)